MLLNANTMHVQDKALLNVAGNKIRTIKNRYAVKCRLGILSMPIPAKVFDMSLLSIRDIFNP